MTLYAAGLEDLEKTGAKHSPAPSLGPHLCHTYHVVSQDPQLLESVISEGQEIKFTILNSTVKAWGPASVAVNPSALLSTQAHKITGAGSF